MPAKEQQAKATECAKAREDQRKEQADLDQQTRAANAGSILVYLTKHQTRIALLQAVLSVLGVAATGFAAWAAVVAANAARASVDDARKDAAEQTARFGRQLKAAQDAAEAASRLAVEAARQVKVSEVASERQLRAYVSITKVEVRDLKPGHTAVFKMVWTNAGQTPAYDLKIRGFAQMRPAEPEKHVLRFGQCKTTKVRVLPPGTLSAIFFPDDRPWSAKECALLNSGQSHVTFAAIYSYRDVFGKRRRGTCFAKYVLGIVPDADGAVSLMMCDRGNRHN